MQAKRVARKRADRAGAVKTFAAELWAEIAAVGWLRLAKRGDPLARGRQAVALIGGEQAALAFALAEPRAKSLGVVPVDVDGGVAVGVLKPGGLPAVGGGVGKGGCNAGGDGAKGGKNGNGGEGGSGGGSGGSLGGEMGGCLGGE